MNYKKYIHIMMMKEINEGRGEITQVNTLYSSYWSQYQSPPVVATFST